MAKIKMSAALAQLPENTATLLHAILKQNLSDDFLVDLDNQKIYINFPEPEVVVDISATGAELDLDTLIFKITKSDGSEITTSLAELAKSAIQNEATSAVELSGNGSKTEPLKADVKISQQAGNQLSKDENGGLLVPKPNCLILRDLFGQTLGEGGADIKVALCAVE